MSSWVSPFEPGKTALRRVFRGQDRRIPARGGWQERRPALETIRGFLCGFKRAEKAIDTPGRKRSLGFGRQARQAHISVPLDGFFQAAKQLVCSVRIHLAELRAIEHNGRTLSLQGNGEFLEHGAFNAVVDALRQVFDGDAACFEYHCGLTPSTNVGVST
jgi:hypothetical protein